MTAKQIIIRVAVGLAVACCVVGGVRFYQAWYDRKMPNFSGPVELYVYPGMEPQKVKDSIIASAKVLNVKSLDRVFQEMDGIRPGHYRVDATCSSMYVARMLGKGWQTPVTLTLSGAIRSPKTLARKVGAQMLVDSAEVADFLYAGDSTRAYTRVIPDSYEMLWTASVEEIFDRLDKEYEAWWTPERLEAARQQGLTREEVSVLASIVDGETRYVPEQPTVAGVYLNRLKMGMKLQADPTIAYIYGYNLRRILRVHLEVESPYNTYKYHGLPPAPISCPPKTCLEAVLHPESHNYIFFCADPSFNGSHRFAATYTEHLRNARAFQTALTERQRASAVAAAQAERGGK